MTWMKMVLVTGVAAVLLVPSVFAQEEEAGVEVSVSADVASAYVFRGVTFNDGPVLQPGVEVSGLPIVFGVWGNLNLGDYDGMLVEGQFSEIDLWAVYNIPLGLDPFWVSIGYSEYNYPSAGGDADREAWASIGLDVPLAPTLDVYYGLDGAVRKSFFAEASIGHELALGRGVGLELGAAIAYLLSDSGEDGFSHVEASADLSWSLLTGGVTYIGQIDDDVLTDYVPATANAGAALGYDVEVVGVLGIGADF